MEDHDNNTSSDLVIYIYSNTLPSVLLNSNNTVKSYREKGCSECQISVRLHASRMKQNILLNDFEYPKDAAIVIEEPTSQVRTDSTR